MPEGLPQVVPDPGVVYLRNLSFGRDLSEIAAGSDFHEAVPRFDLVPSPKSKGSFSLRIGRGEEETEEPVEEKTQKPPFFSNPGQSALTSLEFNRVVTHKKPGLASGKSGQEMFVQQGGYDLTPWVRDVVDKIRNNWTLPPIDESIAMGEVKIFIIVGKKGDLVALEIVQPSDFKAFELTTVGAVRASLPFPPLPDDYGNDRIEAYLVFQFHE